MKWYKHDTDATSDAKIKKLLIRHGAVGYAVYFHCLELIASDVDESNLTFELEHDSEIIADNLKVRGTADKSGIEIVEQVMNYILELGLFEESKGRITCLKMLHRLDQSMTSNMKMRKMISQAKQNHDLVMTESCKNRIDKNRIDKIRLDYTAQKEKKKPSYTTIEGYPVVETTHNKLVESYTLHTVLDYYERISDYVSNKNGKDYKDYAGTARNWIKKDIAEGRFKRAEMVKSNEPDELEQMLLAKIKGEK
jgi:hypothetical protein